MLELTKREIAEKLNLPIRTIQLWTDQGIVFPDVRAASGKGIARLYSERNLLEFAMVKILAKDYNIKLTQLQSMFLLLRQDDLGETPSGFKDFYTDPSYGNSKEMLYVMSINASSMGGGNQLIVMTKEKGKDFAGLENLVQPFSETEAVIGFSILFIGRIKKQAMEMAGVNLDNWANETPEKRSIQSS
ncbi:MerR family transcriptional regulator [Desulfatibacillum aliphaticivorans]|uniref:MerR family transcriptional regulator n=1 Tax=Desulfatibacillum aliphaticivorans TaxID=218208 RepID=UPI000489C7ED|nr:MerR family transcriptional regulator [Desulfatibacillum aliphaticivorans]